MTSWGVVRPSATCRKASSLSVALPCRDASLRSTAGDAPAVISSRTASFTTEELEDARTPAKPVHAVLARIVARETPRADPSDQPLRDDPDQSTRDEVVGHSHVEEA